MRDVMARCMVRASSRPVARGNYQDMDGASGRYGSWIRRAGHQSDSDRTASALAGVVVRARDDELIKLLNIRTNRLCNLQKVIECLVVERNSFVLKLRFK